MLFEANFELLNFCAWTFCLCLSFTRFPTMLAPQTITDKFTIINYQAREYSRDATTGQWTLDGGRCLFSLHLWRLTPDKVEINMTFFLLTLRQIIARHFSPFLISKPWVQERESLPPARRSANTTKSGVSKTSRWRSIEKRKRRKK